VTRINYARPLAFKSLFNYKRRCYPSAVHDTFHVRARARSLSIPVPSIPPPQSRYARADFVRRLPIKNIVSIVRLFMTAHARLKYRAMRSPNLRRRVARRIVSREESIAQFEGFPRRDVLSRARKPRTWRIMTPRTRIRLFFVRLINTRTPVFLTVF